MIYLESLGGKVKKIFNLVGGIVIVSYAIIGLGVTIRKVRNYVDF